MPAGIRRGFAIEVGQSDINAIRDSASITELRAEELESRGRMDAERGREAMRLREEAARGYESAGFLMSAGFNYSKAAKDAYILFERRRSLENRRKALKCFDKIDSQENAAFSLIFYGEMAIRLGRKAKEKRERDFYTGTGMSAIEEAGKRIIRHRLQIGRGRWVLLDMYGEEKQRWDGDQSLVPREEFWRGHDGY
ncbi:MAG: hypothetical protein HYW25_03555 [Candidatus Aenigmarchaeota archaeon]|nr:hypothetical protein [Candidatus Aenigmarchaeota archaeon]